MNTFTDCECNMDGSLESNCNDGQCKCKKSIEGDKCDTCLPGFYGFPECKGEGHNIIHFLTFMHLIKVKKAAFWKTLSMRYKLAVPIM